MGRKLFTSLLIISSLGLSASACNTGGEDDVNNGGDGDADTDTDTNTDEDAGAGDDGGDIDDSDTGEPEAPYSSALVVTTDYQTGAYAKISLDDRAVAKDIDFIHSDTTCRFDTVTNTPFLVLRFGADSLAVLDEETFEIKTEYSVDAASNPQDIAVVSKDRAYVSRLSSSELLVVNPFSGDALGTVDLSDYADDDGLPEAAGMAVLNDKVYVSLQKLDMNWQPASNGIVAIIDAETGDIEETVETTGTNIYDGPRYSDVFGQFVLTEAGGFSDLEGGIELLDPETNEVSGFLITEEALGGNLTKGVFVSETKGYALIGTAGENGSNTEVVSFNPETGEMIDTLLAGNGWEYVDMALTPDGSELWIAAGPSSADPGIRIFDTSDDSEITDGPIDTGLPASHICFTR